MTRAHFGFSHACLLFIKVFKPSSHVFIYLVTRECFGLADATLLSQRCSIFCVFCVSLLPVCLFVLLLGRVSGMPMHLSFSQNVWIYVACEYALFHSRLEPYLTICIHGRSFVIILSSFLNSHHLNVCGLLVMHSNQCLLDIEFVDDNIIYLEGGVENLKHLESGVSLFCERSNAIINWHKSCAIWLSNEPHPTWHPHPSFMWINQGASSMYLGFQIGYNTPPKTIIAPVIHSIQQKLIH